MRLKLISCEILFREICAVVSRSPHTIDIEFMPKGLHDVGCASMLERLQTALDRVDESKYEAVLFGYGLCNNGIAGLKARSIPLVLPRAHDCITLFFGSSDRYLEYFNNNPGTYYKTTGWIERGEDAGELHQLSITHQTGMDRDYEELVAKYGEDNAKYLYDQLCNYVRNYGQFTFIEMGIEPDGRFEQSVREDAAAHGWKFDKVRGDISMLQRLVDGNWNEQEFLVAQPGQRVVAAYNDGIIGSSSCSENLTVRI
jgi:hypothetical protein